ncbi:HK97 family phage prohead protease [Mycobacterium simiae]|uniref:HK97 family phage prohead protease n=1 Tax=Mycobacterium simiae TaxID=1784 RepID=UPI00261BA843|nr:HK97 family phage prohead protease [Mycobacterium simiae]
MSIVGIKTSGLAEGQFEGWASTFGNTDSQNDRVMPGAFAKGLTSDRVVPLNWEHRGSVDPRALVGQLVKAEEVPEGLHVTGQFDLETEFGAAAYRAVKARRVGALSIGYAINRATKAADGVNELHDLDLIEVSIVARPANDRAVITAAKSADTTAIRERIVRARITYQQGATTMATKTTPGGADRYTKGRDEQLALAKQIVDAAAELERDLTADETAAVEKHLDAAEEFQKANEEAAKSADLMARLDAMAASIPGGGFKGDDPESGSGESLRVALSGSGAKSLAVRVAKASRVEGSKALASGVQTVSQILAPDVVPTGRPLISLLDVLPTRIVTASYSYLRQSVRNLAAAPVPVGGVKPTSVVSVTAVPNRLRVVAHISEAIDEYLLADNDSLARFVQDELLYGIRSALQAEIIAGDGTGEHFTGLLNTSGIVVQAFITSALASVRRALTLLQANGYEPSVIALSAQDWEAIELLSVTSGATDVRGAPVDATARKLWGVPVVLNQGLGAKTGLVLGDGAVTLDSDNALSVKWSDAVGTDFTQNQVRCRVEGRWGLSVNQPAAIVKVSTAA